MATTTFPLVDDRSKIGADEVTALALPILSAIPPPGENEADFCEVFLDASSSTPAPTGFRDAVRVKAAWDRDRRAWFIANAERCWLQNSKQATPIEVGT